MAILAVHAPSSAELDELLSHLAAAVSIMDDLQLPMQSWEKELEAWRTGDQFEYEHVSFEEVGRLFMAATEAKEAAHSLDELADELLCGLPQFVNRDVGYVAGEKASD